ncbi:MAG: HlyD family secretion protein [Vicinamibacterales bacterium]
MTATTDSKPLPAPRRPRTAFLVLAALTVLILGGLAGYALYTAGREETDDALIEADVVAVAARVSGVISRLHVKDNQAVSQGALLLELDDTDLRTRVAQARAELQTAVAQAEGAHAQARVVAATARGGLDTARAQMSSSASSAQASDAQIAAAEAALARATAEAAKAARDLNRERDLVAADAIPRTQFEMTELAHASAQAAVEQARAALTASREARSAAEGRVEEARARVSQSTPVAEQIAAARAAAALADARVTAAEAGLKLAEVHLSYAKVSAPADGVVTQLGGHVGALVQAGQPLAQLVPLDTYVVANFKETQIDTMRAGDRAAVRIDAYPGRTFEAVVESLAGGTGSRFSLIPSDNASGNFVKVVQRVPVRLAWTSPPDVALRAGLSAVVTVTRSER